MNKLTNLKNEYEKITIDPEFKRKTLAGLKTQRISFAKLSGIAAAAVLALGITAVNISPTLAYATNDIPLLNKIVKVVTLGRYQAEENGYSASIAVTKIEGLLDKDLEDKLNKEFKDNATSLIAAYEKDVKELKNEFGDDTVHMNITSDYTVKTDNERYLAIDAYIFTASGSSSTVHSFYTIDKKSGELVTLSSLFENDADYITPISDYILSEMNRINRDENGTFIVEENEYNFDFFKEIKPDQNFYINQNNDLVICFDKYEVAAGAQGSPEFVIPNSIIESIKK